MFTSSSKKKTLIFEWITFRIDNYAVINGERKNRNEIGDEMKTSLLGILSSPEDIFSDDYFCEPFF